jgi:N4-gp56 family major capsid protein
MANTFTGTATISNQTGMTNLVQTAYDRYVEMALRSQPLIRTIADKRPVQQAMPGSSVVFQIYQDLAQATSTLTENVDPDAVALSNTSQVTVTLNEYGNAALLTRKLGLFSLSDVDPAAADIIAYNMADSLDAVVMGVLRQGSNVYYSRSSNVTPTATNEVTDATVAKLDDIRHVVAKLRSNLAVPRMGSLYAAYVHPEVSFDIRKEATGGGFQDLHKYDATENFWPGFIGTIEGAMFVETPRMYVATDGDTSAKVYRSVVVGKQALAEATAEEPHTVVGPVTDKLMRHRPLGWYGVLGWARYREAALWRIESGSSINA